MQIKEITNYLESLAPLSSQESYDNSGLLVGDVNKTLTKALICLDSTEEVVDEAIAHHCNLIIAHHPIVFKGLKSLTGKTYVERVVMKCIQNDICLYAIHTNLDNYRFGVNHEIANRIGLKNTRILAPSTETLCKLIVYVPIENANDFAKKMYASGAGEIGNYKACSFSTEGIGTFTPIEGAKPTVGELNKAEQVEELKLEFLVSNHRLAPVLCAMHQYHPYEEVAHDIVQLLNRNQYEGAGMIGELDEAIETKQFLDLLKKIFNCSMIRHTKLIKPTIQKVAFCGGSGSFLLEDAKRSKADIYVTGDFKYHEFFDAEDQLVIADIGHFESEQFTINLINAILIKKFPNFASRLTEINTNPINYR